MSHQEGIGIYIYIYRCTKKLCKFTAVFASKANIYEHISLSIILETEGNSDWRNEIRFMFVEGFLAAGVSLLMLDHCSECRFWQGAFRTSTHGDPALFILEKV